MIPSGFDESNAVFGPPAGMTEDQVATIAAYVGVPPNSEGKRIITRWRPVRAEVEALAMGGSVWLHCFGEQLPPVALGCASPFARTIHVVETSEVIDEHDPLMLAEAAAAIDTIKTMFNMTTETPEEVVEKVARYVHQNEKRKGL